MSEFVNLGKLSDFEPDSLHACEVNGEEVALANIDGLLRAFSNRCTHQAVLLTSFGWLAGELIVCGAHNSIFDTETGEVLSGPAGQPLATYEVAVEGGDVLVRKLGQDPGGT
jgi:nitrite reductase/ring-hydroxylating ferredoxin subunit